MSTMQQIFQKIKTDITKSNPTVPGLIQRLSDYSDELSHASGGSGGDSVEVTQIQSTGTKIASVAVNGVGTDLYAPNVSVTQTVSTGTKIGSVNGTDLYAPAVSAGDVAITAISGITGDDVQDALEALQTNKLNKDNGSVSITADGVKTYSALLDELFALIDFTKLRSFSTLHIGASEYQCEGLPTDNTYIRFSTVSSLYIFRLQIKSSASEFLRFKFSDATDSDQSTTAPASGTEIKIKY